MTEALFEGLKKPIRRWVFGEQENLHISVQLRLPLQIQV